MDFQKFLQGKAFDAYEYFGAHLTEEGAVFRVYAPNAANVEVQGDFSSWKLLPMKQKQNPGVFELEIAGAEAGMYYKYAITSADGRVVYHCDPYGMLMELRPGFASRIVDRTWKFTDEKWMQKRDVGKNYNNPMNIYELHAGSWKQKEDGSWYDYEELAEELIPYLKKMGFNYIEFLPLSEHPADCSWGYQNTGFFAPTSRYGTPQQLKRLVEMCHEQGIGVITDFVPVHFAMDDYGLKDFDGTPLYEFPHPDTAYSEWGTMNFMHSRGEVRSFLQSAANYWLTEFHFDGIRMDAISRAIYWNGDPARGVNERAVEFLRNMNAGLHKLHPSAILMAEDSTDFPKVTAPTEYDGLGFDYKWDMGWMNDTLSYFQKSPWERRQAYHQITFSMMYFYNEKFLLPFSHDEVVHGKRTILDKMWGSYEDKFRQAKLLYTYMFTHPGKKLNFMGNELGHFREWDETKPLDWDLLKYPAHDSFHRFISDLNGYYIYSPLLYKNEYSDKSYKWIQADDMEKCVYVYERIYGDERIVIFLNAFCDDYENYEVRFDESVKLELILNTDWLKYGGKSEQIPEIVESVDLWHQDAGHLHCKNTHTPHVDVKYTLLENPVHLSKKELAGAGKNYQVSVHLPGFSAKIYRVIE